MIFVQLMLLILCAIILVLVTAWFLITWISLVPPRDEDDDEPITLPRARVIMRGDDR